MPNPCRPHFRLPAAAATAVCLAILLASAPLAAQLPDGVFREPAAARVHYDDLDRFAVAHRNLSGAADTLAHLEAEYLAAASPGLRVYGRMYDLDAGSLAAALRRHPERYALSAGLAPHAVRALEPELRRAMERLRELYPAAVFPPVYYLVGPHRAGGALQREGLLIAVETHAAPPDAAAADNLRRLVHLVAHELIHYQQAAWDLELYQRPQTLLGRAIREGAADFLAEMISGDHINPAAHAYGGRHEKELWERFRRDMDGTATGEWMFVTPAQAGVPQDLGYFIGYRIARARFAREADPAAGAAALIRISDPGRFLEESGYSPE